MDKINAQTALETYFLTDPRNSKTGSTEGHIQMCFRE
jgi:hypothetical protein